MTAFDTTALVVFAILIVGYEFYIELPRVRENGITAAVRRARRCWMLEMAKRDVRIFDAQLIGWLSQGNAFFASTSAISVGGLAALLGSSRQIEEVISDIPFAATSNQQLIEFKVILLMAIMVYAFFKFAWAFRLSHYTVIVMGGVPAHDAGNMDVRIAHATQTADLLSLVGEHANRGLRSFYYAIATIAWFLHPAAWIVATLLVILILLRREFRSKSLEIIKKTLPKSQT
ncbi:MAG: DUF599 family protein [Pseudomonadota bacterium]